MKTDLTIPLTVLLFLINSPLLAADLSPSLEDFRSLHLNIQDSLSDITLSCDYGKHEYANIDLKLEQRSTNTKLTIKLTKEDVEMLHARLRAIIGSFTLKDSDRLAERDSLLSGASFFFDIRTPESEIMLRYRVVDRPRVDHAADCYFWLIRKFPDEWIRRVNWFNQFELWK